MNHVESVQTAPEACGEGGAGDGFTFVGWRFRHEFEAGESGPGSLDFDMDRRGLGANWQNLFVKTIGVRVVGAMRRSVIFQSIAFTLVCAYAFLVYCQLGGLGENYPADTRLHLDFVLHPGSSDAAGYSLLHAVCGGLISLVSPSASDLIIVGGGLLMVLLVAAFHYSVNIVHGYWLFRYPATGAPKIALLVAAVFVVSMLFLMPLINMSYIGVFTPNPWHNPTFNFARVFSIVTFVCFLRLTDPEIKHWSTGGLVLFTVSATLSMWAKPSFMMTLGPAMGLVVLAGWIRGRISRQEVGQLAACLVPAVVALWLVHQSVYGKDEASGAVVFAPGRIWGLYSKSITLSVVLALAFPLYVFAVRIRRLSYTFTFAFVNLVLSFLVFFCLAEEGPRASHANFVWSYMGGLFFFFLVAIEEWFLRPFEGKRWVHHAGTVLFFAHLASGGRYLWGMLQGGSYF